jgi:hypothetical protein
LERYVADGLKCQRGLNFIFNNSCTCSGSWPVCWEMSFTTTPQ